MDSDMLPTLTDDVAERRRISKPLKRYCRANNMTFEANDRRATITLTTQYTLMPVVRLWWHNDAYYGYMLLMDESKHFVTIYDEAEMEVFIKVLRGMERLRPGHRRG